LVYLSMGIDMHLVAAVEGPALPEASEVYSSMGMCPSVQDFDRIPSADRSEAGTAALL
jgi:hypothetical protein